MTISRQSSSPQGTENREPGTLAEHLPALYACRRCPTVAGTPVTGAVGNARTVLVGQAPGPHEVEPDRPFAYTAGARLFDWLETVGWSEEAFRQQVHICAVARCFPGRTPDGRSDRLPNRLEIANCASWLDAEIRLLRPELVIAVGKLAIEEFLGKSRLDDVVGRLFRTGRAGHEFDLVP
ncbi:MAG: uracil-DNA glycosylase family protein, partial [Acidobacteria bacterium]|nr:uracil-DNA glycosylase family protein [Acidobacteriota bacterium]